MGFSPLIFYLSFLVEIPLEYSFVDSINIFSCQKTSNIFLRGGKKLNIFGKVHTFKFESNLNPGKCSFIQCCPDSTYFCTYKYITKGPSSFKDSPFLISYSDLKVKSLGRRSELEDDHELYDKRFLKKYIDLHKDPRTTSEDIYRFEQQLEPDYIIPSDETKEKIDNEDELSDSEYLITPKPWSPGDDVKEPYMMNKEDLKLTLDRWPENCFLRVKLYSYYKHLVNLAVERIKLGLKDNPNLKVTNPMALPMRRKRWCYLSSVFIDKRSKDLIEIQEHVRVVDILPVNNGSDRNFKGLLMVPLPDYVSFDYWFEEVHKPVKSKKIHDLFRKRRWVSKHFLYHRDKHKKKELIDKLTSAELENEIPLRVKRVYKADYFFMQLGELRKLYNFVVSRKAEDEARRFYNIKTPQIWEVDDVRFIGNMEDRKYDPDYSKLDKI